MEAYLCIFVNWKQNNWVQLLLIVEFAYNNSKNANMDYTPFEFYCGYHQNGHYATKYPEPKKGASKG